MFDQTNIQMSLSMSLGQRLGDGLSDAAAEPGEHPGDRLHPLLPGTAHITDSQHCHQVSLYVPAPPSLF